MAARAVSTIRRAAHRADTVQESRPRAGEHAPPDFFFIAGERRRRFGVEIDPLTLHRIMRLQGQLTLREGRHITIMEVLARMAAAYKGEPGSAVRYVEVVARDEATGHASVRTCWGELPLDEEELGAWDRDGDRVDLAQVPRLMGPDATLPARRGAVPARARRLSARTRRVVLARSRGLCEVPGCKKPLDRMHVAEPGQDTPDHPDGVYALCLHHHDLFHQRCGSRR